MTALSPPRPDRPTVDPFLHVTPERIEHPLTGRTLTPADPDFAVLLALLDPTHVDPQAAAALDRLEADGWLISRTSANLAKRFRLRIVSIETHTACNQACFFCPVSIDPREATAMADALFAGIVDQLTAFRDTIEAVFLSNYNEPTLDPRLVAHCARLTDARLPIAVNTNATGLTPARVDQLLQLAPSGTPPLRLLSVNLSTLDRDRYTQDRGHDHLPQVLRNLDYVQDQASAGRPLAAMMTIAVLGAEDAAHQRDAEAIAARFAGSGSGSRSRSGGGNGSGFAVRAHAIMDRAGRLPVGLKPETETANGARRLAGCDNLGSRPLQHLHITPAGRCLFCCEDYDERYVIGDLQTMTIREVLEGDAIAQLRRRSYGLDEAPDDFICRHCIFALRR
jgi:hypothetical protein